MTWRIGVATGVCPERPILGVLDAIEASGLRGLEFSTPPHHFAPWQPKQVDQVCGRLAKSPLIPVSMHAPFGGRFDLSDPDQHRTQDTLRTVLNCASALAQLGGTILVVHPTDIVRYGEDVDARLYHAAASLRVVTQGCKKLGLTVAIESPLPHLIGGHPDEFAWLLHHVGPDARVCLDTGHTSLGGHWRQFVEIAGERLAHLHAHDNRGQFDDHLPPGEGLLAWHDIKSTLEQVNYAGWIILELTCPEESLDGYFTRAFDQTNSLLNAPSRSATAPSAFGLTPASGGR